MEDTNHEGPWIGSESEADPLSPSPDLPRHQYKTHFLEVLDQSFTFRKYSQSSDELFLSKTSPQERMRVLCYYCFKCYNIEKEHSLNRHPFRPQELRYLHSTLGLQGFPFRKTKGLGKGFGHFAKQFAYDDNDQPYSLTVTYIRSMRQHFDDSRGSIWRVDVRYNIQRNHVDGVWHHLLKDDRERLKIALEDLAIVQGHPLHLFCAALEVQADFSFEGAAKVYEKLYDIERDVGIARGKRRKHVMPEDEFNEYFGECEKVQNHLVYLQKQHRLLMHFAEFLSRLNDELVELGESGNSAEAKKWLCGVSYRKMHECLENMRNKLRNIDDNIESSLKRAQASSALVNNLMNYQTAKTGNAVAEDSNEMAKLSNRIAFVSTRNTRIGTAIAFGTFIFLPATAVATFFSMSMFDFSDDSKANVSSKFWIFWAVEVPLNIVLLVALLFWVYRKQKKPSKADYV